MKHQFKYTWFLILHISPNVIFIHQFIDFLDTHLSHVESKYIIFQKNPEKEIPKGSRIHAIHYPLGLNKQGLKGIGELISSINKSEKIVLHGINEALTILLLCLMPWNFKKCYWFSWGDDVYKETRKKSWDRKVLFLFKKFLVKNAGHIVVEIDGEYEKIKEVFGAKGKRITSFKYPSNIFSKPEIESSSSKRVKILTGNSADPSNNHEEIFKKLKESGVGDQGSYEVVCPLSYGDMNHAEKIEEIGVSKFGSTFSPIKQFMPMHEYKKLLSEIDIAIFNHDRQQAMGNIIFLLGMGKKVFIQPKITPWVYFQEIGVKLYSIENLHLEKIPESVKKTNMEIIRNHFSEERLITDLKTMFN